MHVRIRTRELRNILLRKNLSQNWLAGRLEVSSGYMSQLLRGSRHPSPALRQRILANFLGSSFDDLFEIIE